MARKFAATLLATCLAALTWTAAAQVPQSLEPGPKLTITAVTQPLPTQPQYRLVDVPVFNELVPQRSGGRIEVKLSSHGERNLTGTEIIRLVRSGQADIGGATLTTVSGDVPFLDGIDLAGLNPDIEQARKVSTAILPQANKELERFNNRVMLIYPFPAQVIFCRSAMASFADLKGRKIRTFGNSLNDLATAVGAQPVSIGFPEVYSALERGVVDCAITGTGSGNSAKWPEVTTHLYELPVGWALTAYVVNLAWWNKLDAPVRTFLEGTFREIEDRQWKLGAEASRDGIDCNIGNAGGCKIHTLVTKNPMTEVKPTEADKAQLRTILQQTVLPNWVKRCGARCGEIYNDVIAPITGVRFAG